MKTIYCLLFSCIIFVMSGFTIQNSKNVILHPREKNISAELLTKSAKIISERLKIYEPGGSFSVTVQQNQIDVKVPENVNVADIEGVLTAKGDLGFYEAYPVNEISALSNSKSDARIACMAAENKQTADSVENILKAAKLQSGYRLLWGVKNSKSMTCLYAVKASPVLTKKDIKTVTSSKDSGSGSYRIDISFKPESVKAWAAATKEWLNKPIAIILDNKVIYTPVVKTPIESGQCEITGDFTRQDANYFLALLNTETLPVDLTPGQ